MSAQIQVERSAYYTMLETTQSGGVEITAWMSWFLACLHRAVLGARASLSVVLDKAAFWTKHANASLNPRQIKLLNRLLDSPHREGAGCGRVRAPKTARTGRARAVGG
jgi:Fic family protein